MTVVKVDVSDKKSSMMVLDLELVTDTDEGFWNWVEHRLDATLGAKPQIISPEMLGPPQMTAAFWAGMTNIMGTSIVELQYQWTQKQQLGATHNIQINRIDNYNEYALAAIMGYAIVFNISGIPRIWVKLQQSKELAENRKQSKKVMECWARTKRNKTEKAILFLNLALEDIIKLRFTPGGSVEVFEISENGITPLMVLTWGSRSV